MIPGLGALSISSCARCADFAQGVAPRYSRVRVSLEFGHRFLQQLLLRLCRPNASQQIVIHKLAEALENVLAFACIEIGKFCKNLGLVLVNTQYWNPGQAPAAAPH